VKSGSARRACDSRLRPLDLDDVAELRRRVLRYISGAEQEDDARHVPGGARAVHGEGEQCRTAMPADREHREDEGERRHEHAEAVQRDQQEVEDRLVEHERVGDAEDRDQAEPDPVLTQLRGSKRSGELAGGGDGFMPSP
jgi:hypothetical protein